MLTTIRSSPAFRFGLLCLPVGLIAGAFVSSGAVGDGWAWFMSCAGVASFLAPALVWRWLVERGQRPGRTRCFWAGVLGAAFAHYLCWYSWILVENVSYWLLGGAGSSLGEAPIDPLTGIVGALPFTLFSYLVIGWATLPVGGLLGLAGHQLLCRPRPAGD